MDYIIVGLGNPGKQYEKTRHNAGWIMLDFIAEQLGVQIKKIKFQSTYCEASIGGKSVLLLKPQTFMNHSGQAVFAAADYYKIPPEKIIVICDDIALPFAKLRIRRSGSAGGHKGLKNIIEMINTDAFPRIRCGVADRQDGEDLADWVTGSFSKEELLQLNARRADVFDAVSLITEESIDAAMAKYN